MKTKRIANWGNYPVIEADERYFTFTDQLRNKVQSPGTFIARGNGRCYGDASLASQTICTIKYNNVLSFDRSAGVFECESGITLDQVLEIIVPAGWFLPVTPGTKFITVGGAVASDVHGKNHHVEGSFSNHIIEMDIMAADGKIITVSPTHHAQLFEATCGGMGLTGVITRVAFHLKKIETSYIRQKQIKAGNLQELIHLFEKYQHYTYSMAWIDCLQKGDAFGRGILIVGEHATVNELTPDRQLNPLKLPAKTRITFPFNLPPWVLNTFTVKVFNALYYAKNLKKEQNSIVPYEPFFYPLDAILHWNRGYGKPGFVQYQFVLPLHAKEGLIDILQRISEKGLGSFLAVLKVFGKQESMISFPVEGYTLALDFPVREGLFEFLDELDQVVLAHGGRLYLSKDARMKPAVLQSGYPRLQEFKAVLEQYNPQRKFRSLQSDRLQLS
jgi:FAD/FMN-containing dehydrogenase